jgi:hypothetical protein
MKHTIEGTVYGFVHEGRICEGLRFSDYPLPAPFFKVADHTIEVDLPEDFDARPQAVAILREQQAKVRAEMSEQINTLQRQINSLLALEMTRVA